MKNLPVHVVAGSVLVTLGGVVALGWIFQWAAAVRVGPQFSPMVFSTAAGFVVAGAALLRPRWSVPAGALLVALACVALAEQELGWNFGLDLPGLHGWLDDEYPLAGRMPAATAAAFLMSGAALIAAARLPRPGRGGLLRVLVLGVGAIGVLALAGDLVSAELLFPGYWFIGVALHTALGLLLLAAGLQALCRQIGAAQEPVFRGEDDRITFIAAIVLVAITLCAGLATFSVLQGRVQDLVREELLASLARRADALQDLVELREGNARIAANRPAAARNLRVIRAGRDDGSNRSNLRAVVESFLEQGFSGIAYLNVDGTVVERGGRFVETPALAVPLATSGKGELLWRDGFYLRHRLPMRDREGVVGEVLAEQALPVLTRLVLTAPGAGETWDMGICERRDRSLRCFPQRLHTKVFTTPLTNVSGDALPMTRALSGETGTVITRDYRRQNVVAAYGPLGSLGLGMVVKIDAAEVFRPIREQLQLAAVLLLTLAGAGTWLLRSQIKPLAARLVAAQKELRERSADLAATNRELEAFSYSVSHDLRAPLRHIDGFADLLSEQAGPALGASERRYLDIIKESVRQMGKLIDDLLAFSRMGRVELRSEPVDMDGLAREAIAEVERDTAPRRIRWRVAALAAVQGDRALLRQVWVNLLSNAVKYSARRDPAEIEIVCKEGAAEVEFQVADNGAGFDMKYADKLFGVFQRLHQQEEFEGTGIGLASVRRIVSRHGGRTWAEGRLNEGARFHFTLPNHRQGGS